VRGGNGRVRGGAGGDDNRPRPAQRGRVFPGGRASSRARVAFEPLDRRSWQDRTVYRVLILTASYGSGHNEAARCIAAELSRRGVEPLVIDHFRDLVSPLFDRVSRAAYLVPLPPA